MQAVKPNHMSLPAIAVVILIVVGCGASGGSDMANLNGIWQDPSNQQKIVINLDGEKKTIIIEDKTLPLTIKPAEADRFIFRVSDTASGEKDWKISRVWDDNGKSFTLKFEHDGQTENLERVKG
jgi:hypothetical protein